MASMADGESVRGARVDLQSRKSAAGGHFVKFVTKSSPKKAGGQETVGQAVTTVKVIPARPPPDETRHFRGRSHGVSCSGRHAVARDRLPRQKLPRDMFT
jgi:hypothetical protein